TGKMVRVRYARDRIIPCYLDSADASWQEVAEQLLRLFRKQEGRTRGELEGDVEEAFGDDPSQLVHQGLAKLVEDRCEFEVVSGHPADEVREIVFAAAAKQRKMGEVSTFDRLTVLEQVANTLGLSAEQVDRGLFADLKSEQRLMQFQDITAERLLQRYN